ncbi:CBO0543 family protein [Paenibacillus sp. y28]|uniref:CBO0543 family protein n=1 Tax=Paenibacillus sp. y28 TaxID=3129110 RepID=UPI00301B5F36
MNVNTVIEGSVWVLCVVLLGLVVLRNKAREALLSFLFMQMPSWLLGLVAVQLGLLRYPARFLAEAFSTSFTYEFMALPTVSALYNLHYPARKPVWLRVSYLAAYTSALTIGELLIKRYTQLIVYVHWSWAATAVSVAFTLQLSLWFFDWFVTGRVRRLV